MDIDPYILIYYPYIYIAPQRSLKHRSILSEAFKSMLSGCYWIVFCKIMVELVSRVTMSINKGGRVPRRRLVIKFETQCSVFKH